MLVCRRSEARDVGHSPVANYVRLSLCLVPTWHQAEELLTETFLFGNIECGK